MNIGRNVLWTTGVCVLYLITAKIGLKYAVVGQTVTLLWLPSGIALAAALVGGTRVWPGVALGALFANSGTGLPMLSLALIVLGNTLEPVVGALLLGSRKTFSSALDKVTDVLALLLIVALMSTTVSASLGTLGLYVGGEIGVPDLLSTWLAWWLGDGMGVLVISPILLTGIASLRATRGAFSASKVLEALLLITALVAVGQAIFGSPTLVGLDQFPVSLSMFPFAIWGGLRFGSLGAAGVALSSSGLAIRGTVMGTGPFAGDSAMGSLIQWCLFADIIAITGLLLGAIRSEREKALWALRASNDDLERRVRVRTDDLTQTNLELLKALAERRRLQLEMNQIGEERQKMIGQELHDSLGQQLTGIAFLVNSLLESLRGKSAPEVPAVHQVGQLLDESISVVRSLSRGLYPVTLETRGLSSALQHLAEHTGNLSGVQCVVCCSAGTDAIDKNTALNLYRIAQEGVCNALRHSQARRIDIELTTEGERYVLMVKDDGIGLQGQSAQTHGSFGMRSMRSRADLIGADIDTLANQDGGTSVRVTGPLNLQVS